ncbi:hypothetical protein [Absidia glauca]|uniref:Uncharacterized protein n=1 Tax=Absidia glauca TaxID=4829 RepID=A0A168LHH8_ABSGL|nr:hypothetical protein [Absidia glauca]
MVNTIRPFDSPLHTHQYFFGDVLFYLEYSGVHYVVVSLYQMERDPKTSMFYIGDREGRKKTVALEAHSIVGPAGLLGNGETPLRNYVFWKSMVIGVDTSEQRCGRIDSL